MTDIETWAEHRQSLRCAYMHEDVPLTPGGIRSAGGYDAIEAMVAEAWGLLDEEAVGSGMCCYDAKHGEAARLRRYKGTLVTAWCRRCSDYMDGFSGNEDVSSPASRRKRMTSGRGRHGSARKEPSGGSDDRNRIVFRWTHLARLPPEAAAPVASGCAQRSDHAGG